MSKCPIKHRLAKHFFQLTFLCFFFSKIILARIWKKTCHIPINTANSDRKRVSGQIGPGNLWQFGHGCCPENHSSLQKLSANTYFSSLLPTTRGLILGENTSSAPRCLLLPSSLKTSCGRWKKKNVQHNQYMLEIEPDVSSWSKCVWIHGWIHLGR